jgi:L-threonylcarbamoyladenylate synthase
MTPAWEREDLQRALETLQAGGVILYPTDTVWGLGCDATNPEAIAKIFRIKQRSDAKSLVVLVDGPAMLQKHVKEVSSLAWDLMDLSEKPLTIVYEGAQGFAAGVAGSDGTAGIRIPNDHFCRQLIQRLKKPLVSTSANISGMPTPGTFSQIDAVIKSAVDYTVFHRQTDQTEAKSSSIIKLRVNGEIVIIRP